MRELPKTGRRGVHDRVDPDYAPTVEVFDNLTHEQIHTGVSTLNPSVLQTSGQSWREAAGGLGDAVTQAYTEISGAIADGWRGSAAGPAAAAVRDFEAAGRALADVLATVGQRLARAGDAAETLRAAIGEPSGAVPDLADALLDPHAATGNIAVQRTTDDARADAVRVMESVYTGAFIPTGAGIPAFPDLPADPGAPVVAPATRPVTVAVAGTPVGVLVSAVAPEASDRPVAPDVPDRPEAAEAPAAQSPDGAVPAAVPVSALVDASAAPAPAEIPSDTAAAAAAAPSSAASTPAAAAPTAAPAPAAGPSQAVSVFSAPVRAAAAQGGDERSREEQQRDSSGNAVTGMGAGAIGGMLGGAMAADTVRSGSAVTPRPERPEPPADDELHWTEDDLTFLEPGGETGELIGALDPTTPPVLGEWSEAE